MIRLFCSKSCRLFSYLILAAGLLAGCNNAETSSKSTTPETEKDSSRIVKDAVNYRSYGKEVNVYTHRHYEADKEIFKYFEDKYNVKVNVVKASADELITRLQREGTSSPADILITVDAGRMWRAKEMGLIKPMVSQEVMENIPEDFRDFNHAWVGLTKRARIVVYAKDRVDPSQIKTYADLADPKWKGKLLVRSSSNIYNQSLVASLIAHDGEAKTKEWAQGVVANFARPPKGNDRDQVKAIAQGLGDIAIVNTYYIAKMMNSDNPEEREAVSKVGIIFPKNSAGKTHINISGAAVCQYSPNLGNASRLLNFLTTAGMQQRFANGNYEYPVNPIVEPSKVLKDWGDWEEDNIPLESLGEYNQQAVKIFDQVGWK